MKSFLKEIEGLDFSSKPKNIKKYTFQDFNNPANVIESNSKIEDPVSIETNQDDIQETPTQDISEETYTNEQLEAILSSKLNEEYERGYKAAMLEAEKARNEAEIKLQEQQKALLENISDKISILFTEIDKKNDAASAETMIELSKILASKIAGHILDKQYLDIIKCSIYDLLEKIVTKKKIIISLNPSNVTEISNFITNTLPNSLENRIDIVANNKISVYDCIIAWEGGNLVLDKSLREEQIDEILQKYLMKGACEEKNISS